MPKGAHILHLGVANNSPYLWAHVWPENELEERHFIWYLTDERCGNKPSEYIGTIVGNGGDAMHLFENTLPGPI